MLGPYGTVRACEGTLMVIPSVVPASARARAPPVTARHGTCCSGTVSRSRRARGPASAAAHPGPGLQRLDGRLERLQAGLRIREEHPGLRVVVELVVDAGVAGGHRALDDDDRPGVVDVEDRHSPHRR